MPPVRFITSAVILCTAGTVSDFRDFWRTDQTLSDTPSQAANAQPSPLPDEKNVIYGMYSGTALLMDLYKPSRPKQRAVVVIMGSGWYMPQRYDATALKDRPGVAEFARKLTSAGYTVFVINHRASPRFRYPAAVEDVQRAVRFVRHHCRRFDIDPDRIGAWGESSGGHLAALLGTMDGGGDPADKDPVNQVSAKVQAVVAVMPATDLISLQTPLARSMITMFMGFAYIPPTMAPPGFVREDDPEGRAFRQASPTSHVTADDAPLLLIHGDADEICPIQQSEILEQRLKAAGVTVRLTRVSGGGHGPNFDLKPDDPRKPDDFGEAVAWFTQHLNAGSASRVRALQWEAETPGASVVECSLAAASNFDKNAP